MNELLQRVDVGTGAPVTLPDDPTLVSYNTAADMKAEETSGDPFFSVKLAALQGNAYFMPTE